MKHRYLVQYVAHLVPSVAQFPEQHEHSSIDIEMDLPITGFEQVVELRQQIGSHIFQREATRSPMKAVGVTIIGWTKLEEQLIITQRIPQ